MADEDEVSQLQHVDVAYAALSFYGSIAGFSIISLIYVQINFDFQSKREPQLRYLQWYDRLPTEFTPEI